MKHENFKRCRELVEEIDKLKSLKYELEECAWFEVQICTNAGRIMTFTTNDATRGLMAMNLLEKLLKDTDKRLGKLYKELDPL